MLIKEKVIKYGDNVDTDVIIPARYLNVSDPVELAKHCMEDLDKNYLSRIEGGGIIVAGANFGCGSSREHAPIAIKASGAACVIAKSFARIFYRNAVNTGLPIIEFDGEIEDGDVLEIDFDKGTIYNVTTSKTGNFKPFPPFLKEIIARGGLLK
jgi:3-isopropylmalate/(R)-2-methylmalate dehydratase small subunit